MRRSDEYLSRLAAVPMFSACTKKDLALIRRLCDRCDYQAGEVLVKEGTRGHEFFVIMAGQAEVTRNGKRLATLAPGDYFGELAFLDPAPRNATVRALSPMEVLIISEREFATLLNDVPTIARKVMIGMARRLHEADTRLVR